MRALLTPYLQSDLGVVLLRPSRDMLKHFAGSRRVLITDEPAEMRDMPSGFVQPAAQPLSADPGLTEFFTSESVISATGGFTSLQLWLSRHRGCEYSDPDDDYHHHELLPVRRGAGMVSLCWHHDNQIRDQASSSMDAMAVTNLAQFITDSARGQLRLPVGHILTLPELCWWAVIKGLSGAIPVSVASAALNIPLEKIGGTTREVDLVPWSPDASEKLDEYVKPVLALAIDPEAPESLMLRPKRRRWECEKYTQWVKVQPCAGCGNRADDPHHIIGNGLGGTATKAHDLFVIPLCRECHNRLHHSTGEWEAEYGSQKLLLLRTLDLALAIGVISTGRVK